MPFQTWFTRHRGGIRERVSEALTLVRSDRWDAVAARLDGRYGEARRELDTLAQPRDTAWLQLAAYLEFRSADMAAAAVTAERALGERQHAPTWNLLGRVRLWLQRDDADPAFARAATLDPEHYVVPYRVSRRRFSRLAEEALAAIPAQFHELLSNTLIAVEDLPDIESVRQGEDPDLLGLYEGGTALERGLPERILLYQRNHENVCADESELMEEVRETMLHEVGHHFGMGEDELPY